MIVTMVTSSYPRFPGDSIATFMEPIATGLAHGGHEIHLVAPWNPGWRRDDLDDGVRFHLFRYAPLPALNVFGYAAGLRADVRLRASAIIVAPLALAFGWHRTRQVVRETRSVLVHAHWVIPSGVIAAAASGDRPLVISLHGSDMFVAERHRLAGGAAQAAFRRAAWVTACSENLRDRAIRLGASPDRSSVIPYGVDTDRFRPDAEARATGRAMMGVDRNTPVVFAFGRLVEKKGFDYLVEATAALIRDFPTLTLVIAGTGDLAAALGAQAESAGITNHVRLMGEVPQYSVPTLLAAADVACAPSVRDAAGNVDGLPNAVLEAMASGTPLVTTAAGGIGAVAADGQTARVVPERDGTALANAIADLLHRPDAGRALGLHARHVVCREYSWARVTRAFDDIYRRVAVDQGIRASG